MASSPATATRTAMAHGTAKKVTLFLLGHTAPAMVAVNPGGSLKALRKPSSKVHMFHCVCSVFYHLRTLFTTEWDITGQGDSYESGCGLFNLLSIQFATSICGAISPAFFRVFKIQMKFHCFPLLVGGRDLLILVRWEE